MTSTAIGTGSAPLPDNVVEVPIFRPGRRIGRRARTLAVGVVLVAGAGVGAWVATSGSGSSEPLAVDAVRVSVEPHAPCPDAVKIAATVTVAGSGTLRYRWNLPGGTTTSSAAVTVPPGTGHVDLTLDETVTQGTRGSMVRLHLLSPINRVSPPVVVPASC